MQLSNEEITVVSSFIGWCFVVPLIFIGGGVLLVKRVLEPWLDRHQHFTCNKRELSRWIFFIVWAMVCFFGGILFIG